MTENQSPFTKLHTEEITAAKKTLLDELSLPPKVTRFIRENANALKIAFIVVTVLVCAWTFYNYYTQKQKNDSTAFLSQAVMEPSESRTVSLQKVIDQYSGSGAAVWSSIAMSHESMKAGKYGEAREKLAVVLDSLSQDNPLYPLVVHDMAQAYELDGDLDMALAQYGRLREIIGFALVGYLSEARIYEQKNDTTAARETYEKVKTQKDLDPAVREWIDAKLALM